MTNNQQIEAKVNELVDVLDLPASLEFKAMPLNEKLYGLAVLFTMSGQPEKAKTFMDLQALAI